MQQTQRFKRVATARRKKFFSEKTEPDHDSESRTGRHSKSVTVKSSKPEISSVPNSGPSFERMTIMPPEFFQIDALDLAPRLLGKFLRRDDVVLRITEVEAYRPNDSACHGRFGITARTAPVFGPGGHAYVYLCYGLHKMLNVVADKEGVGAAVLIRSCAPVSGLKTIQQRRGLLTEKPVLLTGPGKILRYAVGTLFMKSGLYVFYVLTVASALNNGSGILHLKAFSNMEVGQALGLSTEWSNHPLYAAGGLEILDGPEPEKILTGPRVGIEYALPEHVNALWRFAIAGTPWISAPKNTLRPP